MPHAPDLRLAATVRRGAFCLQVTSQLKIIFTPDPKVMNNRINDLIEREFLARKEGDATAYVYIA